MPLDSAAKTQHAFDDGLMAGLMQHLPEDARGLFSEDHLAALDAACGKLKWNRHPVDIRLSIPTLFNRYYLVVLGGQERRGIGRRDEEKRRHPFRTVGNFLFLGGLIALGIYGLVFLETLFFIAYSEAVMN